MAEDFSVPERWALACKMKPSLVSRPLALPTFKCGNLVFRRRHMRGVSENVSGKSFFKVYQAPPKAANENPIAIVTAVILMRIL